MGLEDELERIAAAAAAFAEPGERVVGVLAAEPAGAGRVYVCAFEAGGGGRGWLALDAEGAPLESRLAVRDAVSLAAMCEVAADSAGGGDLEELRARLVALRLSESPPGIDEAEEAALALERVLGVEPRVASPGFLDDVGAAVSRLERALGEDGGSPFVAAMRHALGPVGALADEVEAGYKRPLR